MIDVKDLLIQELSEQLEALGVEDFRADQILDWVYKKYVCDFDKMTNLPRVLRNLLKEKFYVSTLKLLKELVSKDGTMKFLYGLEDGERIESVFIPSKNTKTVCVSSQVGCKFGCKFCASGKGGFVRNLRPAEMVNQVLSVRGQFSNRDLRSYRELSPNVVFMGMGEPLDNYENVLKAIRILNAPYGLNIGQRRLTISTCGLITGIRRLAGENLQVELSISLHSANDKTRSSLMGINNKYPIKELITACREYIKETNRQLTFEYVLIKGLNDSREEAEELAKLLKGMLAKVNLIPFNPIQGMDYLPPEPKDVKEFKNILDKKGIVSVVRVTRGADIQAACGQLRSSVRN